jgi:hypothetical protein
MFPDIELTSIEYDARNNKVSETILNLALQSDYNTNRSAGTQKLYNSATGSSVQNVNELFPSNNEKHSKRFSFCNSKYFENIALNSKQSKLKSKWTTTELGVVSNGVCLGECGLFVRALQKYGKVTVYTYGGTDGQPFRPSGSE